jgi:FHA domain
MNDPRLNSMHLDFPRRDEFRKAREALLDARGLRTVAGEKYPEALEADGSFTMVQNPPDAIPDADYWLMDHEGVYPLKVGVNTVGRLPDNDIVIPGPYVSRRHCAILVHAGDGCEVYDVASKNGTFVNGLRLCGPTQLSSGDEIRMCDRQFVFISKEAGKDRPDHGRTDVVP